MVKISIICLIYCSPEYSDWIFGNIQKYTPKIRNGEADFLFVANDPTVQLINHLKKRKYPYIVSENKHLTEKTLLAMGYGKPEHIHRVYRGYNAGITATEGDIIVLINSDMCFSPDWLENLLKYSDRGFVVSSQLVERKHKIFGVFPSAYHCEFGSNPSNFNEKSFLKFVSQKKITGLRSLGAYMPSLMYRDIANIVGKYPQGNIVNDDMITIKRYGDEAFFDKLNSVGVIHVTALDSIVYHFKEGERESGNIKTTLYKRKGKILGEPIISANEYCNQSGIEKIPRSVFPTSNHLQFMEDLLKQPTQERSEIDKQIIKFKKKFDPLYMKINRVFNAIFR